MYVHLKIQFLPQRKQPIFIFVATGPDQLFIALMWALPKRRQFLRDNKALYPKRQSSFSPPWEHEMCHLLISPMEELNYPETSGKYLPDWVQQPRKRQSSLFFL